MMIDDYAGGEDGNHIILGDDLLIPTLGGAPKDDEEDDEDEDNDDNEDEKMFKWVIVFITNLTILVTLY